jgi:hypothetical protein
MIDLMTATVGGVKIMATENRGHSPEEITDLAIDHIVHIGENAHPLIAQQAQAFKENLRHVLNRYFALAQRCERTTICAELSMRGHEDMAEIIRRL